jgi:peptidoglycan/xylan/chitin deacetylase (PgdA/CDA1 family)
MTLNDEVNRAIQAIGDSASARELETQTLDFNGGGGDRSETVAAVPGIIRALRDRGYELVTVPKLVLDPSRTEAINSSRR